MQNNRSMAVNETLRQLSFQLGSDTDKVCEYLDAIADLLKVAMGCQRVTVWLLQRQAPGDALTCAAWSSYSRALKLTRCNLPDDAVHAYLQALLVTGVLAVPDVRQVPALDALNTAYCAPDGILATLDAAFVVNGQAVGVVCCEQIGEVRDWLADEQALVRRVAQAVTLDLARVAGRVQPGDDCADEVRQLLAVLRLPSRPQNVTPDHHAGKE